MEDLFRPEVIENRKYRLEGAISLQQPAMFKMLTVLILSVLIISLIFLSLGNYTRKERVVGLLQPSTGLLKLSAPQTGTIQQLLVKEGTLVAAGETLMVIKSEKYGADGFELSQSLIEQNVYQLKKLGLQLERQKKEHQLQQEELNNTLSSNRSKLTKTQLQRELYQQRIKINESIVTQLVTLGKSGYGSELELNRQNDNLLSLKQQSLTLESELFSITEQTKNIENQLAKLPIKQENAINQLEIQIEEVKTALSSIKQQKLGELRAPVDGVVTGILVNAGTTVSNTQNVLSILPKNSRLQAIIYIPTAAFGFIEKGQQTRIRYHAFPYEKFGIFDGSILEVSANVILPSETEVPGIIAEPSYRVVVKLADNSISAYGNNILLRSGMTLDADIIIEQRSLLRWLFDPVFSIRGQL